MEQKFSPPQNIVLDITNLVQLLCTKFSTAVLGSTKFKLKLVSVDLPVQLYGRTGTDA
eukprot:SAG31_NODE_511_length_14722_cov_14.770499_11_plen_58_part_00